MLASFPGNPIYGPSKRYVRMLSEGLSAETGIKVTNHSPGYVPTKINEWYDEWDSISTQDSVRGALADLGIIETNSHWKHELS